MVVLSVLDEPSSLLLLQEMKVEQKKKKEGEEDEYMSHLVSYKWFRRTIHIPRFGGVLQE